MRRRWWALGLLAPLCAGAASAQPVDEPAPTVDVADLPPLPPAAAGAAAAATVAAAIDAEEDVVVGAAKREQSLGDVASAVTVVSADRLRRFGYRTIGEALRGVAGLYLVDDRITDRIGIRGLSVLGDFNTRVLVLVDGATLNEPWGQYAGVGRDAVVAIDDVARLEVIRGPVSSVYGTNAFFGIINIVTRGAAEAPRGWARLGGSSITAGELAAGFAAGTVDRQLRGTVTGLWREGEQVGADGIGDALGSDGARAWSASLTAAYDGAFAQARVVRRARDNPLAPFDSIAGLDSYTEYDTLALVEGGYAYEVSRRTTVTGRAYGAAYRFADDLLKDEAAPVFHTVGDARWIGAEARVRHEVLDRDRLGLTAGVEATLIDTTSRAFDEGGPDQVNLPIGIDTEGLYLELDSAPTAWLAMTAGVRADRNSRLEERLSPRAALFVAKRDRYGAKLLYAEGFRNPSVFEGFFDDGQDFLDNPAIGAETIRSTELVGWARPWPGLSVRVSGFRWDADGIVEQEDVGGRLQFQNVGRLRSTGVEVEGTYRDRRGWYAFAGGGVADARAGRARRRRPGAQRTGGHRRRRAVDATAVGSRTSRPSSTWWGRGRPGSTASTPGRSSGGRWWCTCRRWRASTSPWAPATCSVGARRSRRRRTTIGRAAAGDGGDGAGAGARGVRAGGVCAVGRGRSCSAWRWRRRRRAQPSRQGEDDSAALVDDGRAALRIATTRRRRRRSTRRSASTCAGSRPTSCARRCTARAARPRRRWR
ncbi:MAG: TonB-dependent receptor [Kofleriaceae bacterium]